MSEHDHMEEYFRDRAENFDYPFNEKDWQSLEARLDHELPTSGGNFWGQVLIGILIISLPWWPWDVPTAEGTITPSEQVVDQTSPSTESTSNQSMGSNSSAIASDASSSIDETQPTQENTANPSPVNTEVSPDFQTILSSSESVVARDRRLDFNKVTPTSNLKVSPGEKSEDLSTEDSEYVLEEELTWEEPNSPKPVVENSIVDHSVDDSSETEDTPESRTDQITSEEPDEPILDTKSTSNAKVWRPFLVAGFEYGGTQMDKSPQLGYRAGFGVRYQPLEQWSFSASVLYANIRYTAYGNEYEMGPSSIPSTYELSWTDGTCRMIEIPIEVRYHALPWLNAGLGLRSYYVIGEQYDLYMESNYYPSRKYPYSYDQGSSVLAAHLDLSVGFTIPIKGYQLEIQPFYQLPLTGIGHGSVEWKSAGISTLFLF